MGFTACQKEIQEEVPADKGTVQVTFVADSPDTKTSVDTSDDETPFFSWDESETFAVLEQQNSDTPTKAGSVEYEKVDGKAKITATFGAGPYVKGATIYHYVTIYPASGYVGAERLDAATLSLPAVQTMAEGSYDPDADLMVSTILKKTEPPTEAQMVSFTRMAAVAKMTLKNFSLEAGDEVEQVIFTAEGKTLAGTITADLANPNDFAAAEGVDNVTVNTTSSSDVYFTLLPTTLEAGAAYTVTVITKEKLYIKTGTIPAEKSLAFEAGMVTRFGVNMSSAAPSEKWVLVRDASTLKQGDVVTIAAKNYNYVMSANWASNYPYASAKAVIKVGDYLYHPDGTANNEMVQKLTLAKRDNSRNAFDFYDGKSGFLMAPGSGSKYLKLQEYYSFNTQFDITIDSEGVATIIATNSTGSSKQMMYNHSSSSATSRYFHCYSSITDAKKICLYKLEDKEGTLPTVTPNIEVPDSDESVVISEDETADATAISDVVFNYVGDWTITPSVTYEGTDTGWLNVTYDAENNYLTYTAEANAGAKRYATVTLTATLGEQTLEPWTFNVIQKGVPQDISIAEFVKLSKDENSTYRITGKVVYIPDGTSASSNWEIADENNNIAKITYFKTDSGLLVKGNVDIKEGDIVTLTAVPVGSGKGGNSSHESIYKGHYGLSTIKGLAADYRGGTVEIDVTTYSNGTITLPDAVEASITDNDYAELTYSDGKAVVTFATENETSDAREAVVTFTYGLIKVEVVAEQGVNPANRVGWNLVTNASTLAIGNEVVIVAMNSDKVLGAQPNTVSASGITSTSNFPAVEVDRSGNIVYDVDKAGALVFTLAAGKDEGTFALQFTHKDADYYLNAPSTGLKGRAVSSGVNAATSYTITIDSETGKATIQSGQPKLVMFNGATGTAFLSVSPGTANATKAEYAVSIYRK